MASVCVKTPSLIGYLIATYCFYYLYFKVVAALNECRLSCVNASFP